MAHGGRGGASVNAVMVFGPARRPTPSELGGPVPFGVWSASRRPTNRIAQIAAKVKPIANAGLTGPAWRKSISAPKEKRK